MRNLSDSVEEMPLIVAELSGNHGGSLKKALELVVSAKNAGADAVKLQTYKPETITVNSRKQNFLIKDGLWKGKYLHDLYQEAMTPWEWHREIDQKAKELGLFCFSSPFDETAVDFLEDQINPPFYKIASFELNHIPLLKKIGLLKKTVFASVGVSNDDEIKLALETLWGSGCPEVILLHCISKYPAGTNEFGLSRLSYLRDKFKCKVGLSDHSPGYLIPTMATALGATVIEKHLTLDRQADSIDGKFSLLPEEFLKMSEHVREAHVSMGFNLNWDDEENLPLENQRFKRSILASRQIEVGEPFSEKNIRIARPNHGLCPSKWELVIGTVATRQFLAGDPLKEEDVV
jgi:pseudaminic acid synthase